MLSSHRFTWPLHKFQKILSLEVINYCPAETVNTMTDLLRETFKELIGTELKLKPPAEKRVYLENLFHMQ
jgi:hypothetical protein